MIINTTIKQKTKQINLFYGSFNVKIFWNKRHYHILDEFQFNWCIFRP